MKKTLVIIATLFLFINCHNVDKKLNDTTITQTANKPIEININNNSTDGLFISDSLFNEPTIVRLETNKNNLIGVISQLLIKNDLIIVVDNSISKSINVFDITGKYKYKIGKLGNGPGEYISCNHVSLLSNGDTLAILDDKMSKIHYYRITGNYLYSKKFEFSATNLEFINSTKIAFVGLYNKNFNNNKLIITDKDNKTIHTRFKGYYKENVFNWTTNRSIYRFENKIFFNPAFNDTIFEVQEKTIIPRYYVNIAYNKRPKINDNTTNKDMEDYLKKYISFNGDFFEFKHGAIFYFQLPNPPKPFALYSKSTGKIYRWNMRYNNPYYKFLFDGMPVARYSQNTLIYSMPAQWVLENKNEFYSMLSSTKTSTTKANSLYKGLSESDNPVLFFYSINFKNK